MPLKSAVNLLLVAAAGLLGCSSQDAIEERGPAAFVDAVPAKTSAIPKLPELSEVHRYHPDFLAKMKDPAGYRGPSSRFADGAPRSLCSGTTATWQDVNRYDGTLGVTQRYVWKFENSTVRFMTASGVAYCSGTLIAPDLVLTASHCLRTETEDGYIALNSEETFRPGEPWTFVNAHDMQIVEDGFTEMLDYAIVRLDVSVPNFGQRRISTVFPLPGEPITIIQHPQGLPKKVESGHVLATDWEVISYDDIDTLNGASGAGILDANGFLVGVHTRGGCDDADVAQNSGVLMKFILDVSPILSAIASGAQPDVGAGNVHIGRSDGSRFIDRGFPTSMDACGTTTGTCRVGDVTGDGRDDIVHFLQDATGAAQVKAAVPTLPGAAIWFDQAVTSAPNVCTANRTCVLADVNGDGRADAVEFSNDAAGDVNVALSNGTSFAPKALWHPTFCLTGHVCSASDVTGDGRADLVAFTRGTSADVYVAASTGTSFGAAVLWNGNFCQGATECRLGDVNGDGRSDVVAFTRGTTNDVLVSISTGASFGATALWHGAFCGANSTCDLADLNGDGRGDAVEFVQGNRGATTAALSTGSGFGAAAEWHPKLCFSGHSCLLGDVDGDNKADAFTLTRGG